MLNSFKSPRINSLGLCNDQIMNHYYKLQCEILENVVFIVYSSSNSATTEYQLMPEG